jgi:hypothetical protein
VGEVITGARPFDGATYHELLTNIVSASYHLPGETSEVRHLDEILQSCLAKESSLRFASAAELQAKLILALRRCPPFARLVASANEAETVILRP